ncbi:MAG: hypothetical protein ACK4N5_08265 [Myxococcales bacterium]
MRSLLCLLLLTSACSLSPGEFHERAQAARTCTTDDGCALTEARGCLCPEPVAAGQLAELNRLAGKVDCGEVVSRCAEAGVLRCVEGRCAAVKKEEETRPAELPRLEIRGLPAGAFQGPRLPGGGPKVR